MKWLGQALQLFEELCELGDDEQQERLRQLQVQDPGMWKRVRAMLKDDGGQTKWVDGSAVELLDTTCVEASAALASDGLSGADANLDGRSVIEPGDRLGPYEVVGLIASGGMGSVWEGARRDGQFEQRVAIKVLRGGTDSAREVMLRREQQVLASLEHPGIASILDAGHLEGGAPYFVMEFIDGVPIDAFCRERDLRYRERVSLLLGVCGAVDYSHRRLVLHGDLKPGNVLVTSEGHCKLVGFWHLKNPSGW